MNKVVVLRPIVFFSFYIRGHPLTMWTVFWTFLTPFLPHLLAILPNNAYVVIWTFDYLPPLSCPHGLWMPLI